MNGLRIDFYDPRVRIVLVGIFFLLIRILFSFTPGLVETIYSRGLFVLFRWIFDHTFALLPFPGVLIILLLIGYIGYRRWKKGRKMGGLGSKVRKRHLFLNFLSLLSFVWITYLLTWGFNYARPSLVQRNDLGKYAPDTVDVREEVRALLPVLSEARQKIDRDTTADSIAISFEELPGELELRLNSAVRVFLKSAGYNPKGEIEIREMAPNGLLLRFGISGIYFPFTGEGHVDGSLQPGDLPFTMAHEIAHGYGITDESEANAVAYFACLNSGSPLLEYVAHLNHFRYLAAGWYLTDSIGYRQFVDSIPVGVKADLIAIKENRREHPALFPALSEAINDLFLRLQGIEEGIRSYGKFVVIVKAWQLREGD